ncbi:MAG: right-handed parallel beta-helix repeat-containing protein [Pseudomonadota bacterium]
MSSATGLIDAVAAANKAGNIAIVLTEGVYQLDTALRISADHIVLESFGQDPKKVTLRGRGMREGAGNLITVSGRSVRLSGLTLEQAGNHLVQLRGEADADFFTMTRCILRDSWEQLFKVSKRPGEPIAADGGTLQSNLFEYSERFGPQYYIGGVDMHGGSGWEIVGNTFRNIASPAERQAEHAIHLWRGSADNVVRNNLIINSDRGIGFGLTADQGSGNYGGVIEGNVILHYRSDDPFSDVGISLESSPRTLVTNNMISLAHSYPNAIEYRFEETRDVRIIGNHSNKAIASRDGGQATLSANTTGSYWVHALDLFVYFQTRITAFLTN